MSVSVATILARIRTRLNETTQRFFQDAALIQFYNEGAENQHHTVLHMARQQGRLTDMGDPYLRNFAKVQRINVLATGQQLYALPADFHEAIQFTLSDPSLVTERVAQYVDSNQEWFVRNIPQMGPTYERPMWSLQVNPDNTTGMCLQVFVHGDRTRPNAAFHGRLYYYRDVTAANTDGTGNVDLPDPYSEGPIWYAVGNAMFQRGDDPTAAMALYASAAQTILAPMAASTATTADAQAAGGQGQVAAQDARQGQ